MENLYFIFKETTAIFIIWVVAELIFMYKDIAPKQRWRYRTWVLASAVFIGVAVYLVWRSNF